MNARVRMSNQYLKLASVNTLSEQYKNILVAKSAEVLAGKPLLPLPKSEQKMYSATEIGEMFNVSAQKVGRIANAYELKPTNTESSIAISLRTPVKKLTRLDITIKLWSDSESFCYKNSPMLVGEEVN